MLSAGTAYDESRKGIGGSLLCRRIVFGASFDLLLNCLEGDKVDDGFVCPFDMILGLLSVIYQLTLGEVVFAVGLLQ